MRLVYCLATTFLVVCCLAEKQHDPTEENVAITAMRGTRALDQIVPEDLDLMQLELRTQADVTWRPGSEDTDVRRVSLEDVEAQQKGGTESSNHKGNSEMVFFSGETDAPRRMSLKEAQQKEGKGSTNHKGLSLHARVIAVAKKAASTAASLAVSKKATLAQVTAASTAAAKRAAWGFVQSHVKERSEAAFRIAFTMALKEGRTSAYASTAAHAYASAAENKTFRKLKSHKQRRAETKIARQVRAAARAQHAKLKAGKAKEHKAKAKLRRSIGLLEKYVQDTQLAAYSSSTTFTKRGALAVKEKVVKAKAKHIRELAAKATLKARLTRERSRKRDRRLDTKEVARAKQKEKTQGKKTLHEQSSQFKKTLKHEKQAAALSLKTQKKQNDAMEGRMQKMALELKKANSNVSSFHTKLTNVKHKLENAKQDAHAQKKMRQAKTVLYKAYKSRETKFRIRAKEEMEMRKNTQEDLLKAVAKANRKVGQEESKTHYEKDKAKDEKDKAKDDEKDKAKDDEKDKAKDDEKDKAKDEKAGDEEAKQEATSGQKGGELGSSKDKERSDTGFYQS